MGLDRINTIRKQKNLTTELLAEKSGVPLSTIKKICAGITTNPNLDTVKAIAKALNCKLDDFDDEPLEKNEWEIKNGRELEHIKKYRSLTDNGRKAVDAVTEVLYEAERATEPDNIIRINVRRLPLYTIGASAGCGNPLDDSPYDIIEIGPEAPIQTSFLLKADGDSMEPLIQNGETLYIKQQDHIEDGEIGIFWFDGDVFVKKQEHRHGGLYLVSLNPKYKPIKIIDDSIHCFGKVLNK